MDNDALLPSGDYLMRIEVSTKVNYMLSLLFGFLDQVNVITDVENVALVGVYTESVNEALLCLAKSEFEDD